MMQCLLGKSRMPRGNDCSVPLLKQFGKDETDYFRCSSASFVDSIYKKQGTVAGNRLFKQPVRAATLLVILSTEIRIDYAAIRCCSNGSHKLDH